MTEGDKGVTYSFSVCKQCIHICCQDAKPPLSRKRKEIIKKYLEEQKINIQEPFVEAVYSYAAVDELLFCAFFDKETRKCSIHPVKPETCVAGPITFDINFSTKKLEWFLKKSEICSLAPILYGDKEAFKKHLEVAKKQLTELICDLDVEALSAVLKIDVPETFKIEEDALPPEIIKKLGL
ncbi:MAG TPA: YkgJ family cysteine cluster protein [Candidatus Limnocylindrales bacterium]|nr:YkgJ family cysteine cluster protein [Candidatus Limnocylindrales bacterium]